MSAKIRGIEFLDEGRDRPLFDRLKSGTKAAFAEDLGRLQRHEKALQCEPVTDFGSGVMELKRTGWRVIVSLTADPKNIWIICVFPKDSKRGPRMRREHSARIKAGIAKLTMRLASPPGPSRRQ